MKETNLQQVKALGTFLGAVSDALDRATQQSLADEHWRQKENPTELSADEYEDRGKRLFARELLIDVQTMQQARETDAAIVRWLVSRLKKVAH
jgi:hypothetical protein